MQKDGQDAVVNCYHGRLSSLWGAVMRVFLRFPSRFDLLQQILESKEPRKECKRGLEWLGAIPLGDINYLYASELWGFLFGVMTVTTELLSPHTTRRFVRRIRKERKNASV